jgi:hypothetical protein
MSSVLTPCEARSITPNATARKFRPDAKRTRSMTRTILLRERLSPGVATTGFQPFLTLRDANAGNKRGVIQPPTATSASLPAHR